MSYQGMPPICCNAFAISSRDCTARTIVAAPTKPDSPDKLPKAPAAIDTSAKAYPIPVKPSLMSSHAILPISLKAFAISSRD